MKKNILLIGIGNEFRSDDRAGKFVCELVKDAIKGSPLEHLIEIEKLSGEGAELIESWKDYENVYIADAAQHVSETGKLRRIETSEDSLKPDYFHYSSHSFSLAEAAELSRQMGMLPSNLVIYSIEGGNFGSGTDMSFEVEVSCLKAARMILEEISFLKERVSYL
ncbi:MAG: hydrogenase maturation protease [Ignavibacteria bacterium]